MFNNIFVFFKKYIILCLLIFMAFFSGIIYKSFYILDKPVIVDKQSDIIAIVNRDTGIDYKEDHINYSKEIISSLGNDYSLVSKELAEKGILDGRFSGMIIFSNNFSKNVISVNNDLPEKAEIYYKVNQNLSDKDKLFTTKRIYDIEKNINSKLGYLYINSILKEFGDAQIDSKKVIINNENTYNSIEKINITNILRSINISDLEKLGIDIQTLDMSKDFKENENIINQISTIYNNSSNDITNDMESIKNNFTIDLDELKNFNKDINSLNVFYEYEGFDNIIKYYDDKQNKIFNDKKSEFQDFIASISNILKDFGNTGNDLSNQLKGHVNYLEDGIHKYMENMINTYIAENDNYTSSLTDEFNLLAGVFKTLVDKLIKDKIYDKNTIKQIIKDSSYIDQGNIGDIIVSDNHLEVFSDFNAYLDNIFTKEVDESINQTVDNRIDLYRDYDFLNEAFFINKLDISKILDKVSRFTYLENTKNKIDNSINIYKGDINQIINQIDLSLISVLNESNLLNYFGSDINLGLIDIESKIKLKLFVQKILLNNKFNKKILPIKSSIEEFSLYDYFNYIDKEVDNLSTLYNNYIKNNSYIKESYNVQDLENIDFVYGIYDNSEKNIDYIEELVYSEYDVSNTNLENNIQESKVNSKLNFYKNMEMMSEFSQKLPNVYIGGIPNIALHDFISNPTKTIEDINNSGKISDKKKDIDINNFILFAILLLIVLFLLFFKIYDNLIKKINKKE